MPDFLSEPQRWVIPAVLIVSIAGVLWTLWRERNRPSAYTRRADSVEAWMAMSTAEQRAADDAALPGPANLREWPAEEETAADVIHRAEESAQFAAELASRTNALFRP